MAAVTPRTALVVGGASGIGAACVAGLAEDGWAVAVADRQVPGDGVETRSATVDVRDPRALQQTTDELVDNGPLHGLVYAAGIGRVAPLAEITAQQWQLVVEVNLNGAFHAVRAALPHMVSGAAIVLISSIDSTAPVSGLGHYCASKAGLDALGRSIALELGPRGIRCNIVAPGPVRTPLMNDVFHRPGVEEAFTSRVPLGTLAEPSQIADVVVFLLSASASHLTGARVPVDGGMSLREHPSMLTHHRKDTMSPNQTVALDAVSTERCEQLLRELVRIRSVVGERHAAHLWVTDRLRELGMTSRTMRSRVQGAARARRARGRRRRAGGAVRRAFRHRPRTARRLVARPVGRATSSTASCTGAAPSTARARTSRCSPRSRRSSPRRAERRGPIYFMSDSDGEDGFRGAVYSPT